MSGEPRALVSDVQRFSLHDGPGVRTVVFFKGCPLRCRWCQNPESIGRDNELLFSRTDCIDCGDCVPACPAGALRLGAAGLTVTWRRCDGCMRCVDFCPARALTPVARAYDVETLVGELLREREFFGADGGVTLSGGEPLLHVDFVSALVERLQRHGVHVAVQTAGYFRWPRLAALLERLDLILFDVKVAPEAAHRRLTGASNAPILDNLRRLLASGAPLRVRMPLVPTLNDDDALLAAAGALLCEAGCREIWLLPYHRLWESKLAKIGGERRPLGIEPPTTAEVQRCADLLRRWQLRVHVEGALAA